MLYSPGAGWSGPGAGWSGPGAGWPDPGAIWLGAEQVNILGPLAKEAQQVVKTMNTLNNIDFSGMVTVQLGLFGNSEINNKRLLINVQSTGHLAPGTGHLAPGQDHLA